MYRTLPIFFLTGAAIEWFMINVRVGNETFCKCFRFVFVCVCVCVCVVYLHVCTCVCMHVCTCVCMHVCVWLHQW